jgi:hypothetical protein
MIGYFEKDGDADVGEGFHPYKEAFNKIIKRNIKPKVYGDGLDLILIEYHLEGRFLPRYEEKYRLKSYRKNEHSIAVVVFVSYEFRQMSDLAKRKFIVDTTIDAVHLVQTKMAKLGFASIDFPQLIADIEECRNEFMNSSSF